MRYSSQGRFQQQVRFLQRQFLQNGDLPFSNTLSKETIADVLRAVNVCWLDRIYTPLITLWVFLNQVLSQDHSCRAAVARLVSHRISRGEQPCAAETGAYCLARKRLPEELFSEVARQTGRALDSNVDPEWLWKRRRVYLFDGSSVSMPDTAEEPARLSATRYAETRPGLSSGAHRGRLFSLLRCGAGSGNLPLRRQGSKRVGNAAHHVGQLSPRGRHARRSSDVFLDGLDHAPKTRSRCRLSLVVAPECRLSPWQTFGET